MRPFRRTSIAGALVLVLGTTVFAVAQSTGPFSLSDGVKVWTIDGGGGDASGGDFELRGTVGQPDARRSQDGTGDFRLNGGFWTEATGRLVGVDGPPASGRHELAPPTPNPFNPRTTVRFRLAEQTHVRVQIHDVRGRLVRTLVDDVRAAGTHTLPWSGRADDGTEVASGVYFLRLVAGDQHLTQKMTLLK